MKLPSVSPVLSSAVNRPAPDALIFLRQETPENLTPLEQARFSFEKQKVLDQYLADHRGVRHLDLTQTQLSGLMLEKYDLSFVNLYGAQLNETRLDGANLNHANLSCASLQKACLRHASMHYVSLVNTNLYQADLRHADMRCADFHHAFLSEAMTEGADLEYCNIEQALVMPY